jgi:hypothetical protein
MKDDDAERLWADARCTTATLGSTEEGAEAAP